jgi:UDPglucose 6-dehydrogenase
MVTREGGHVRISVVGLGYVGATHAACMAAAGHDVIAIDVDESRVARLSQGQVPFHEPGLEDALCEAIAAGRLTVVADLAAAAAATVHFVCVGTPQADESGAADLGAVNRSFDALAAVVPPASVLVGKSTVPVGTATALRTRAQRTRPDVEVAWNPEFLREGNALADSTSPDRLVFGAAAPAGHAALRAAYAMLIAHGVPVVETDLETAELAKVAGNVMLAARISTVNALAELAGAAGAQTHDLLDILGLDSRLGSHYLTPGIGYGGSCLPKDLRALEARGRELGADVPLRLLRAIDDVNLWQRTRTVELAQSLVHAEHTSEAPATVAVLGLAFKAGSDDIRDSPALAVAVSLASVGLSVRGYDPLAGGRGLVAEDRLRLCASVQDACKDASLLLVLTEAIEFAALDPVALAGVVRRPQVIDGRRVLDAAVWRDAGWSVHTPADPIPADEAG